MKNSPKQSSSSVSNQLKQKLEQIYPGKGVAKIAGTVKENSSYLEKSVFYRKIALAAAVYERLEILEKKLIWVKHILDLGITPIKSDDMGKNDMEELCTMVLLINSLEGVTSDATRNKRHSKYSRENKKKSK